MRHADAGVARRCAGADAKRRLTAAGTRAARTYARALRRRAPAISAILTSPLPRARATAAIVARVYGITPTVAAALAPAQARVRLVRRLRRVAHGTVLAVGHDPDLSALATWLIAGPARPLAKSASCALALRQWRAGGARLLWWWD